MREKLLFVSLLMLPVAPLFAQQHAPKLIMGTVQSGQSGPFLSGVTLTLQRSQKSTVTKEDGSFYMQSVYSRDTLIVRSLGYKIKYLPVSITDSIFLSVNLQKNTQVLQGVTVSTGYQEIPKERATGSFDFISEQEINQQKGTNILDRLEGMASGVLFDFNKNIPGHESGDNLISVRGLSTINGPVDPLVVLNGFIYEGNIGNINPSDVESISVLKDAAATSIWGARAANGVIVIKTKTGKLNQEVKISFDSRLTVEERPDLYYLPQMRSGDYIDVEAFLFHKGVFDLMIENPFYAVTPAVEIFHKRALGLISSADSARQISALRHTDVRDQYLKYFYTNPLIQQYALNLRGGGKKNSYAFSVDYNRMIGEVYSSSDKINISAVNTFYPVQDVEINLGVYYTNGHTKYGRKPYNSITINGRTVPYLRFADQEGNPLSVSTLYKDSYTDTVGGGALLDWKFYPLEDYKHVNSTDESQEIFTTASVRYIFSEAFDLNLKYQYQVQDIDGSVYNDVKSFDARNKINLFSEINHSTGVVEHVIPEGGIKAVTHSKQTSYTARAQLNFKKRWNAHRIVALFGGEARQKTTALNRFTIYGYQDDPLTTAAVDFVGSYPQITTGQTRSIGGSPAYFGQIERFVSLYGNASYSFRNRYTISASARKDGSNIFGVTSNNKWTPLWSAGLAWNITNEPFYHSDALSFLKFRLTYGYSGNVDVSKSAVVSGSYHNAQITNYPAASILHLNNPELRWEKSGMINFGIDFSLKNDILSGSIEYYHKKGSDLYGDSPIDRTVSGYDDLVKNVANMKSNGVDLDLRSNILRGRLKWMAALLFNYNVSKTTKYFGDQYRRITTKFSGNYITPVVGYPLFAIAGYRWGGLDANGDPQGYLDGKLSTDYNAIRDEALEKGVDGNIVYFGPTSPTIFGSVDNRFSWRNFSLSFNFIYKFNYFFKKPYYTSTMLVDGRGALEYRDRWQKAGDEKRTSVPAFRYPADSRRSDFYANAGVNILRADNIRLHFVNLSYHFDMGHQTNQFLEGIELYCSASNLGIVWKATNSRFDPDFPEVLPPKKQWTFGLSIDF